ncbi:hypothetical protein [Sphingomonas paucimobilis]|uniref:hypothetical protein n=1 Tax=Sphingomonas paucimobilis TaxID=13689 RepID=UPI0018D90459|nr:hypothetical protein [Sphingomonas paucimobilis]
MKVPIIGHSIDSDGSGVHVRFRHMRGSSTTNPQKHKSGRRFSRRRQRPAGQGSNPQRPHIFRHDEGIADRFEEQVYDMSPVGEQRQWKQLKMNPWGETPTLELAEGSCISETAAVVRGSVRGAGVISGVD